MVRVDCVKDVGVTLDSKLYFHNHVDNIHSHVLKLLGIISYIMYISSLDSLKFYILPLFGPSLRMPLSPGITLLGRF
jgi:hypothetical protein